MIFVAMTNILLLSSLISLMSMSLEGVSLRFVGSLDARLFIDPSLGPIL